MKCRRCRALLEQIGSMCPPRTSSSSTHLPRMDGRVEQRRAGVNGHTLSIASISQAWQPRTWDEWAGDEAGFSFLLQMDADGSHRPRLAGKLLFGWADPTGPIWSSIEMGPRRKGQRLVRQRVGPVEGGQPTVPGHSCP